jgi:hypothetical protein
MKKDAWLRDLRMKEDSYYKLIMVSIVLLGVVVPTLLTLTLAPYLDAIEQRQHESAVALSDSRQRCDRPLLA